MAVRQIRIWPDPALAEVAKPVTEFDDALQGLVQDLFDTMYEANGVGLAATQIAVPLQVLVIDLDPSGQAQEDDEVRAELEQWGFEGPVALINPEILSAEGSIIWQEGCLSVPGYTDKVKRHEHVVVRSHNPRGDTFEFEAHGLFAVAVQHEMDHLTGRVFVEYLSKLKRDVVRRKMERWKSETNNDGVAAAAAL